ncbi:MAG: HAD family hydrolase [Solirubrobacterales bacterium]|nr:HAD family hydrolase [Solirubrobacterales bacterium]
MWEEPGTVREARRRQVELALQGNGLEVEPDAIETGLLAISDRQREAWLRGELFQPHDGARHFIETLGHERSEEHDLAIAEALLLSSARPELNVADGLPETLRALKGNDVRISIVCDVGLAPSTVLRACLEGAGLLEYFDGWAFSDEVGHYKPAPEIFEHALQPLGVEPADAIHVGDLRRTDVAGSRSFGMTSVRYRGVAEDDDLESAEADHVIGDHREILDLMGLRA